MARTHQFFKCSSYKNDFSGAAPILAKNSFLSSKLLLISINSKESTWTWNRPFWVLASGSVQVYCSAHASLCLFNQKCHGPRHLQSLRGMAAFTSWNRQHSLRRSLEKWCDSANPRKCRSVWRLWWEYLPHWTCYLACLAVDDSCSRLVNKVKWAHKSTCLTRSLPATEPSDQAMRVCTWTLELEQSEKIPKNLLRYNTSWAIAGAETKSASADRATPLQVGGGGVNRK